MHNICGKISVLNLIRSEPSGFDPWPGTLCCVLRQDTLLSLYSLSGELLGKPDKNCGEVTLDGLPSRPGEVEILPAASCDRNRDKLRQLWFRLGSKASLVFTRECETGIVTTP